MFSPDTPTISKECRKKMFRSSVPVAFRATPSLFLFADKIRAGHIFKDQNKLWRVLSNTRSQKGQLAATYNIKAAEVGNAVKTKDFRANQGHDFPEVRTEKIRLLFSGFDDDDFACFVFPEHHSDAGKEINIKGDSLPEQHQKFLACGMSVDVLHVLPDEDDGVKEMWTEVSLPSSHVYTVEKIQLKGMYKMGLLEECDGTVSVTDAVQIGDKIKINLKTDGTSQFMQKL